MSDSALNTYGQMWEELGLNLHSHCALLDALGPMYRNACLTQENRPKGMEYFDFMISEIHGLRIKELQDHKAAGGKVVGTFCLYVPEEVTRALGQQLGAENAVWVLRASGGDVHAYESSRRTAAGGSATPESAGRARPRRLPQTTPGVFRSPSLGM